MQMQMQMLPPPPPPPPPPSVDSESLPHDPPQKNPPRAVSLDQVVISKLEKSPLILAPYRSTTLLNSSEKSRPGLLLLQTRSQRTNPLVWCAAILCLLFSLSLILFGISTLIIFLSVRPRCPSFEIPAVNLNSVYFDSPEYFNGDMIFLANFSNPNRKLDLRFESLEIGLYFSDRLVATQVVQPFVLKPGEKSLDSVHFLSSLVYLPDQISLKLQKQVQENRVSYDVRGSFRVKASLGIFHYSYWLHPRCRLDMTGPPTGVLITSSCRRKR
ncbi:hypothetical protein SAY86_006246 [Trapa natans]|uniref:Late embryogenesis abundant protein LEA-2 subgroup domain-containing protein n=1 Tax=Trapa natans TaxID=22666 RepID=A0AAN7L9E8_TRANT|nr:hypothetical protein SAY86_006246 [Trapa natans]